MSSFPLGTSPPHVALAWKEYRQTSKPYMEVSLVALESVSSNEAIMDHETANQDETPRSVLIYERQLRKAQHAKKAGKVLACEDLRIVHVDEHIVVVNKPPGVLTVPGINANPSVLDLVYKQFGSDDYGPQTMIVHRLDMDTSGLVIFSRSPEMTKKLHTMFREQQVSKEYECLVTGHFPVQSRNATGNDEPNAIDHVMIDLPLQRDHENPPFMRVSTPKSEQAAAACVADLQKHGWQKLVRKRPKPSRTSVTVIEHGSSNDGQLPYTRLRLVPITGRTHQLRVHCAALGYPIVGDPTYGMYGEAGAVGGLHGSPSFRMNGETSVLPECCVSQSMAEHYPVSRCPVDVQKAWTIEYPPNEKPMCLHAALLELTHPVTGQYFRWETSPEF